MKNILLSLTLLLVVFPTVAQNYENRLYPLSENGKRYYVNIFGERITNAIYDDDWYGILENNDIGWIKVKKNDMYGIIDTQGREIVSCLYQNLYAVERNDTISNLLSCQKNNKYGIITIDNKKIVPFIYDDIQPFLLDNDIIMCRKNEKWGAINVYTGKTIIPFEYDEYNGCFENKLLSVRKEKGHNGYINTKGNVIIPLVHDKGFLFRDDGYTVLRNSSTGIWYSYDNKGKKVEIGKYEDVSLSQEKRIIVKKNGKYGFVNSTNGKCIVPCIYDKVYNFCEGRAIVSQASKGEGCAVINQEGKLLTDFSFGSYSRTYPHYEDGYFITYKTDTDKYGVIDRNGKVVIPFTYEHLGEFFTKDGYIEFREEESKDTYKYGVINKFNNIIIPASYDGLSIMNHTNLVCVRNQKKWGIINFENKTIQPLIYDDIESFYGKQWAKVKRDGKMGIIDRNGNIVVQCGESEPYLKIDQYFFTEKPSDIDDNIPLSNTKNNKTFAIIISNEKYIDEDVPDVSYSINDGKSFREYCTRTLGIPLKNIKLLENATFNQIRSGINGICDKANAFDGEASIIVYYSGHGMPNEKNGNAYLLPIDGSFKDYRTAIGIEDIYKQLGEINTKQTTVFLDACFSGTSRDGKNMLPEARGVIVKTKPAQPTGNTIIFSASQGDETSHPYKKKKHGMFTYFLLKKLQETKGQVSLGELGIYVSQQVRQHSIMEVGKSQSPTINVSNKLVNNWKSLTLK